jgi:hypothetical protein
LIERAYIRVDGPARGGKTTFIEAVLTGTERDVLAARCRRNEALRQARESRPRSNEELRRYRQAGASGGALFEFPKGDAGSDAFFMTDLMSDYSEAVIVEGDNPLAYLDLDVFVAPPLEPDEDILVKRLRDHASGDRAKIERWQRLLGQSDGVAKWLEEEIGIPSVELFRRKPELFGGERNAILVALAKLAKAPPAKPTQHWGVAERYAGIESAGLVVVNVRDSAEHEQAERLVREVARIRSDEAVFKDVLSFRGHRIPITAVVADLADPGDAGRKRAIARVRRAIKAAIDRG